jgi:hypothetical protein
MGKGGLAMERLRWSLAAVLAEKHDDFATRYELNIEEIMAERRQIENKQWLLATLATECGRPLTRREKSHALTALALGMV